MSAASDTRQRDPGRPLVLALTATPLLTDLLRDLLETVAVVRYFPAGSVGLDGLVRHTRPDALVIDSDQDALELFAVADELSVPVVQILLPSHEIRVFRDGNRDPAPHTIESPTTIRNLLIGVLFHSPAGGRGPLPAFPGQGDHRMEA